eukprot:TRINITY_DN24950_c0_g1_i1.p1 TRINITY_DN24950_c0_g1~~TRINITY_DN24950_c0_g1_i1.p1  ORF type:complete len:155 (+),score=27.34 TRINITY_DN24950_c0_g1_i1:83-547(+)
MLLKPVIAPKPLRMSSTSNATTGCATPPLEIKIDYVPEEMEFTDIEDEQHPFYHSDCLAMKSPSFEPWRQQLAEMDELQSIFVGGNPQATEDSYELEETLSPTFEFPYVGQSPAPNFKSPSRAQNPIPLEFWKHNSPPTTTREKRKNRSFSACK